MVPMSKGKQGVQLQSKVSAFWRSAYTPVPMVNTVLYIEKFVRRIDFMLGVPTTRKYN